jgi:protein-L-isoaspartate(D-aspartate) O-methyltransferase
MTTHLEGVGMTSPRARERMVENLAQQGIRNKNVLDAMRKIPRHIFLDEALASRAYENNALPIGFNQTISQPYIVARMTELLLAGGRLNKVLEIGTGCGYQTAVLAQLVGQVYSVERLLALQKKAQADLRDLKLRNTAFFYGDGTLGWPDHAPYDGIIVTAAPLTLPETLLEQLALGGVMIIPVGSSGKQNLQRVTRTSEAYEIETLEAVSFVPFMSGKE